MPGLPVPLDPYAVLDLARNCTLEDVKRAYRRAALAWHPDRNPTRQREAARQFQDIAAAYEILSDASRRNQYDREGAGAGRAGAQVFPDVNAAEVFTTVFGDNWRVPPPPFFGTPVLLLLAAIVIDFIGVVSYLLPMLGEGTDFAWAPISAYLIHQLFDSTLFAAVGVLEEILPGTDIVPTACICWLRTFWRFVPTWATLDELFPSTRAFQ
jgi:curved DNA-binding protein CbpA